MKTSKISRVLDEIAPGSIAANWDNSGWQIRQESAEVTGVLLSIDVTPDVIDEATRSGINLIVSHHPLFYDGVKALDLHSAKTKTVAKALESRMNIFSMHTNLDVCPHGTSFLLAQKLGLGELRFLSPLRLRAPFDVGWGAIGRFEQSLSIMDLRDKVAEALGMDLIRVIAREGGDTFRAVAVGAGSLSNLIPDVIAQSIGAFITSDMKYHDAQDALGDGVSILDVDHYYAERPVLDQVKTMLEPQVDVPVMISGIVTSPFTNMKGIGGK